MFPFGLIQWEIELYSPELEICTAMKEPSCLQNNIAENLRVSGQDGSK